MLLIVLALLALLTQPVRADGDDDADDEGPDAGGGSIAGGGDGAALPDTEAAARSAEIEAGPDKPKASDGGDASADGDSKGDETFLQGSKPRFTMASITPAHGPVTGDTRVTVRGAGLEHLAAAFPEPKCRFGSDAMIVTGAYVGCPPVARGPWDKEAKKHERTATCI